MSSERFAAILKHFVPDCVGRVLGIGMVWMVLVTGVPPSLAQRGDYLKKEDSPSPSVSKKVRVVDPIRRTQSEDQEARRKTTPPSPLQRTVAKPSKEPVPVHPGESSERAGVQCRWFGHAFIYLTSVSGLRFAMDPYSEEIRLPYPEGLQADAVLISFESPDRSAGERLDGTPMVFRGVTGLGLNNVRGLKVRGVGTYRDHHRGARLGTNVAYITRLDGITFCHLGGIAAPPTRSQYREIGEVDVLFLPVGNRMLTVAELREIAEKVEAKWIVPIAYYDEPAGFTRYRKLEEFTSGMSPTVMPEGNTFTFRASELPKKPTLLILTRPSS